MQTKKQSFFEALTNTAIGFVIAYGSTFIIFPLMGIESSPSKNIIITLFFTAVSILRGYLIRRFFNKSTKPGMPKYENPPKPPMQPIETYEKCCKKNCYQPVYEMRYCFHHYLDGEIRMGH